MDEQEIARLRELAEKLVVPLQVGDEPNLIWHGSTNIGEIWNRSDGEWIIDVANALPALLDENAQQRVEIARLREALEKIVNAPNNITLLRSIARTALKVGGDE